MLIRDSLRRLLQLQIGVLIPDFVTGRVADGALSARVEGHSVTNDAVACSGQHSAPLRPFFPLIRLYG